ncbi:uncharacterized protein LOC127259466 [Andrographis paniculata]|uniref:uncharacterized protein LOC127259466 n=1 Tax=Andrographis paniculata TaxID=175694 RepID=UPI0021E74A2F|nr:uncharacterized protein LOC127259466 [Andrographis paniculata]
MTKAPFWNPYIWEIAASENLKRKKMRPALENGSVEAVDNIPDKNSPHFTSNEGSRFKENMNINRFETPKLAMEPLQMKKKKKGGGFNVRKSLAWDRAFFTEEGVLDPHELSVISSASCREGLSHVKEHESVGSRFPSGPIEMQKLQNNIYTELQTGGLTKGIKKERSSLRLDSSSSNYIASACPTSNKVPTLVGYKKSGSSCGDIPRPISSSSLKRPANVIIGRASAKEFKMLKVPGSKSGLSPACETTKKTSSKVNHVKHDLDTQPGLKSPCENLKKAQNGSKSRQPTLYSDGNTGNSSYRRHSTINMSPILVNLAADNSGSKMITPVQPTQESEGQHELATSAVPLPRNARFIGRSVHPPENQALKPSGLRMPSPSLSFFSQTIPSAFSNVSLRGTEADIYGSWRYENSRLKENLRNAPEIDNKTKQITAHCKDIKSSLPRVASSHVGAASVKVVADQAPMQKETKFQDMGIEEPLQTKSQEQGANEIFLKRDGDCYTEKSDSCKSGREKPEVWSEQIHVARESETVLSHNESSEENNACDDHLILNHGAIVGTECKETLVHIGQISVINSDAEDVCRSDCHGRHKANTGGTANYCLDMVKQESAQVGVSQQIIDLCSQSGSLDASECWTSQSEISYLGSEDLHADLSKDTSVSGVSTGNLVTLQPHIQNAAGNSREIRSAINLISEVGDDTKELGKGCKVLNNCPEAGAELQINVELNSSERLPENQICPEEQDIEKLTFSFPEKKDGSKVADTKLSTLSLANEQDCSLEKGKIVEEALASSYLNSVDDYVSPDRQNNVNYSTSDHNGKHEDDINYALDSPTNINFSNSLHEGPQRPETDCIDLPSISKSNEVFSENTTEKIAEQVSVILDDSANNQLTLPVSYKENESDQSNIDKDISETSSSPALGSPSKYNCCEDAYGTCESLITDSVVDSQNICPLSDTINSLPKEDNNSYPKLGAVEVEAALAPANDMHGDGLNTKSCCSSVLPQNAVPFSDEWFAALEAAGEDILTKKSGAVQNSPPDKSQPEPSPWSPVKKRSNQIGPFDCTKFTNNNNNNNNAPSDSN